MAMLSLVLTSLIVQPDAVYEAVGTAGVMRLVFASCKDGAASAHSYAGNNFSFDWSLVGSPDAFIWAGDAIYADQQPVRHRLPVPLRLLLPDVPWTTGGWRGAEHEDQRAMYEALRAEPGYDTLRASSTPVLGTWDDHDFGIDDGDRTFPRREDSKVQFLDFLDAPADDARRLREGVGVWGSTLLGEGDRSILVIALDLRYHRDSYGVEGGDILGEEQWIWCALSPPLPYKPWLPALPRVNPG